MVARFVRLIAGAGMLVALVLASSSYGATELENALAGAEQRGRAAQMAEPAYPNQAAEMGRAYRYVGTGREQVSISPLTLAQADAEAPGTIPAAAVAPAPAVTAAEKEYEAPVFSIKEDLRNTPRWLWEDTKRVYTSPLNLVLLMTAGGASIALHQHVDWTIANKFDRAHTCQDDWRDTANIVGHPVLHLGIAGAWYLAGYQFKDLKTYNVGKNLLSALIITDLSTLTLKVAAAGTETPSDRHLSWPSGHASSTFAMASVMHEAYGPLVGVPLYGLAGWVSFERMDDRKHFFSDVLFGGMLGLVVGHSVASGHLPQIAGGTVLPYADPVEGSAGFAWIKATK